MEQFTIPPLMGVYKDTNARNIPDNKLKDAVNVIFRDGKIKNRPGLVSKFKVDSQVMGIDYYYPLSGEVFLFAFSQHHAYKYSDENLIIVTPRIYKKSGYTIIKVSDTVYDINFGTAAENPLTPGSPIEQGTFKWLLWANGGKTTNSFQVSYDNGKYYCIDTLPKVEITLQDITAVKKNDTTVTITLTTPVISLTDFVIFFSWDAGRASFFQCDMPISIKATPSISKLEKVMVIANENVPLMYFGDKSYALDFIWNIPEAKNNCTPFKARYVKNVNNHVVLGYITDWGRDNPQMVMWSDRGYIDDYYNGTSGDNMLLGGDDWIVGMEPLGDRLLIYKERSIVECIPTNNANEPFIFNENKLKGIGTPSGRTVGNLGDEHIFLGWDDVYIWDGNSLSNVGGEISKYILERCNQDDLNKAFGIIIEEEALYALFIPTTPQTTTGSTATTERYCSAAFIYNYNERTWAIWEFPEFVGEEARFITTYGYDLLDLGLSWFDLRTDSKFATAEWGSPLISYAYGEKTTSNASPINLLGATDGVVYRIDNNVVSDDGVVFKSTIETKDYASSSVSKIVKEVEVATKADSQFNIEVSTDHGATWSRPTTIMPMANPQNYVDIIFRTMNLFMRGPAIRIRLTKQNDTIFEIESISVGYDVAGREIRR